MLTFDLMCQTQKCKSGLFVETSCPIKFANDSPKSKEKEFRTKIFYVAKLRRIIRC